MRHPDGTALFDWDFYNITGTANFMLSEQAGADKKDIDRTQLVPEGMHEASRGRDMIKRHLGNLGTIGNGLAELLGLMVLVTESTARHPHLARGMPSWPSAPPRHSRHFFLTLIKKRCAKFLNSRNLYYHIAKLSYKPNV